MQTKLTLRMDDGVIRRAKCWAYAHGISLSRAVEEIFSALPRESDEKLSLSPWVRRLAGAARSGTPLRSDEERAGEYLDRLEEKYR